jgi:hypothetical protein
MMYIFATQGIIVLVLICNRISSKLGLLDTFDQVFVSILAYPGTILMFISRCSLNLQLREYRRISVKKDLQLQQKNTT